jgi:hypothetical protein
MKYYRIIAISFLAYFIFIGGSCPETISNDLNGTIKIARESEKFLSGCPDFFYPPNVYGSDPTHQHQTGAVGWCPTMVVGNPAGPETKNGYITRLDMAKVQNQTSWFQYQQIMGNPPSGFPGYYYYDSNENPVYVPTYTYQTGFICYSLVYRSILDASYYPFNYIPLSTNDDRSISWSINFY